MSRRYDRDKAIHTRRSEDEFIAYHVVELACIRHFLRCWGSLPPYLDGSLDRNLSILLIIQTPEAFGQGRYAGVARELIILHNARRIDDYSLFLLLPAPDKNVSTYTLFQALAVSRKKLCPLQRPSVQ